MNKIKKRLYEILEKAAPGDTASQVFDIFIMSLIFLNVLAVILGTVKSLAARYGNFFRTFEVISVIIFTVEYVSRVWTCTVNTNFKRPLFGRIHFMLTPLAIVDLIAILPFYLPMLIPFDLRFVRVLRLIRMFRLFKVGRYSESMQTLGRVMKAKREELSITVFVVLIILVLLSSLMYFVENTAQPDKFASIPAAMWWGVATLTTVGYGDVYPVTTLGKFLGAVIALLGIGMFALPAGILGGGFVEEMQKKRNDRQKICPHCGKRID